MAVQTRKPGRPIGARDSVPRAMGVSIKSISPITAPLSSLHIAARHGIALLKNRSPALTSNVQTPACATLPAPVGGACLQRPEAVPSDVLDVSVRNCFGSNSLTLAQQAGPSCPLNLLLQDYISKWGNSGLSFPGFNTGHTSVAPAPNVLKNALSENVPNASFTANSVPCGPQVAIIGNLPNVTNETVSQSFVAQAPLPTTTRLQLEVPKTSLPRHYQWSLVSRCNQNDFLPPNVTQK